MNLKQLPKYLRTIGYNKPLKVFPLAGISVLITLTELLSILLIFPIIQAFLDFKSFSEGKFSAVLSDISGVTDKTDVAILLVGILTGVIVLRGAISYFGYRWIFSVISRDEADYASYQYRRLLDRNFLTFKQSQSSQIIRDIAIAIPTGFSTVLQSLFTILSETIVFVGLAIYLLILNPEFFIGVLVVLLVSALFYSHMIGPLLSKLSKERHELTHKSIGVISESLEGIGEIKNWQSESFFADIFYGQRHKQAAITASQMAMQYIPKLYFESIVMIIICASLVYILLSGMDLATFLPLLGFYVIAAFRSLPSVLRLSAQYNVLVSSRPGIETIFSLNDNHELSFVEASEKVKHFSQTIDIQDISFAYNDNPVLEGLSVNLRKGEMIGISGRSGEGKTTLVNIMTGLLMPKSGQIILDDEPLTGNFSHSLLSLTGYVSQNTFLLNGTIRANIAFGLKDHEINDDKVRKALSIAQLDEFVASLPNGINHIVGERGSLLSGGQRQRIGIARAFYFDRDILVLDEVTSSLDSQTEKSFVNVLQSFKGLKTIILISHRAEPLAICDRVYEMKNGRLFPRERIAA